MKFNFSYRPDIDGMRAIAVLLVIFYHAGFHFVTGGYIGVDVFFVLSGFLITLTIDTEMSENRFSFKQFYLRRIRRIIPVLFFVMLITTIPAYLFLFAEDLEAYSRTLLHTMLSTNNFHLWIISSDYFAVDSNLIPFLHTWSLSVEEQFYFLWPISLLFLHKKLNLQKRLIFALFFLFFGIILSIYLTHTDQNLAYFLLPARLFELAIGACLALFWDKLPELSKTNNHLFSILGLVLILVPAYLLTKESQFPGMNALWPCLGAAILIFTGKNTDTKGVINTVLQNRFLVLIGLLSYSMYLLHWPLFVFISYLGANLEGTLRIATLFILFLLSYFSWKFIEQPFRINFKYDLKKTMLYGFLPALICITGIYAILDGKDGFPNRFPNLSEFTNTNYPNKVRAACYGTNIGNCKECYLGIQKDTLDGLLIGDSFANHSASFLNVLAKDAGLYIHDTANPFYPLLNALNDDGTPQRPADYAIKRLEYAKKFKYIYIAACWETISNPKSKNHQYIVKTIGELVKLNKKIVVIDCLRSLSSTDLHKAKLIKTDNPVFFSQTDFFIPFIPRPANYIVYEIKKKYPSVLVIDLNDAVCKYGKCAISLDDEIIYKDGCHLTSNGARQIGEKYIKLKGNPLKKF